MADTPSTQIKVLFFAKARELCGLNESDMEVPSLITCEALLNKIVDAFSLHSIKSNIILAINEEYKDKEQEIHLETGDVVAVIPPLSGG